MAGETFDFDAVELLFGHTDEETALVVDDYPYGRRVRTQIRYWLETTKNGDRFVSQTLNPKTGRWNKPKKSTYLNVAVMYRYTDEKDGILKTTWTGLGTWPDAEFIAAFCGAVGVERLSDAQRRQLAAVIGRTRAFENVTFEVREGTRTPEEEAEQARIGEQIGKLVAVETYAADKALKGVE